MSTLAPELRVDWPRVLEEIRREGYSLSEIAQFTRIPKTNLMGYRNLGAEPLHATGVAILKFWAQTTAKRSDDAPLVPRMPSAGSFRR